MPFVVRSDSENEHEAELVFLSPQEEPDKPDKPSKAQEQGQAADQGASPILRRSNRKRKSTTTFAGEDMSKSSSSKKKKGSSPEVGNMPKLPRTPQGQGAQTTGGEAEQEAAGPRAFEAMLLAMEARLGAKMERAAAAAEEAVRVSELTAGNLEKLEAKVDGNELNLRRTLEEVEERMVE